MSSDLIRKFGAKTESKKVPSIKPGDTVEVDTIIRDGDKQRIQKFKGLIIAVNGTGATAMFTVRKISYGIGVEKKFPIYSTNIAKIKVVKTEPVRRAKLYFMKDRVGKSALRVRKGRTVLVPEEGDAEAEANQAPVVTPEVEATPAQ